MQKLFEENQENKDLLKELNRELEDRLKSVNLGNKDE